MWHNTQSVQTNGFVFVIELQNVTQIYEGSEKPSLSNVNLKIEKGEFCLLTGPSGAGKSTLLRLLFLALKPTQGEVILHDHTLSRLNPAEIPFLRREIGVVFQDFKLLPHLTVYENTALTLEVRGLTPDVIDRKVKDLLIRVGLGHRLNYRCEQLSGGEQQRVAIARALIGDPFILLCDEPTGNLDPERSNDIMELLLQANARGSTVIVATHDPTLINNYQRRVLRLNEGELVSN